ncbi:MAG TPA: ribbon-helix-helix protein, CopG family [Actinomycetes bacterium]|nr:ribbon-helix-helix protein, CopG family [Actinomycetes bacterium]
MATTRDGGSGPRRSGGTRNMVLRLDPDLAERLQTVADVEGRSMSDVVREAITELVERRRKDQAFIRLLEENLARHERVLRALRDGGQ